MSSKALNAPAITLRKQWAKLCADPALADLPYKIETNRHGKIIMSPADFLHSRYQSRIDRLLYNLMSNWEGLIECAIETADGVKVPDVAAASPEFCDLHSGCSSLPFAPEICGEVASPSNSRKEMLQKMRLYLKAGALEVWFCDNKGRMEFWEKEGELKASWICPDFPKTLPTR